MNNCTVPTARAPSDQPRRHVSAGNAKHAFTPYTPLGCTADRRPVWALPKGIDGCIVQQATALQLDLDHVSASDRTRLARRVKTHCAKADEAASDHRKYCVTAPVANVLWDAGACQTNGGTPNLGRDGNLVCSWMEDMAMVLATM